MTDILGWSRPFRHGEVDETIEDLLDRAGMLTDVGDWRRATVRVSSLGERLFLHSAYPTVAPDSVFFGPDSYRFARFLTQAVGRSTFTSILDIGTGSGVGAIVAAGLLPSATVAMTDINPAALRFARINAAAAGVEPRVFCGDVIADFAGHADLILANPPYIVDPQRRAYRDGGGLHGAELSLRITSAALERLSPRGRFMLYTGSSIVDGHDHFADRARDIAAKSGCTIDYQEIDPDVFGEELANAAYARVDRIAAVGVVFART